MRQKLANKNLKPAWIGSRSAFFRLLSQELAIISSVDEGRELLELSTVVLDTERWWHRTEPGI